MSKTDLLHKNQINLFFNMILSNYDGENSIKQRRYIETTKTSMSFSIDIQ